MAINGTALDGNDSSNGCDRDDYLYDTAVAQSMVDGAEYDRLYINQYINVIPFTFNYTNASSTTSGSNSFK